jgi:predicted nucleic acid-binding protein
VRPIAPDVVVRAMGVAITHNRKGVGGVDVLHLATASHIQARLPAGVRLSFATADHELKQLATEHGLPTFDPLRDPLSALPRRPSS